MCTVCPRKIPLKTNFSVHKIKREGGECVCVILILKKQDNAPLTSFETKILYTYTYKDAMKPLRMARPNKTISNVGCRRPFILGIVTVMRLVSGINTWTKDGLLFFDLAPSRPCFDPWRTMTVSVLLSAPTSWGYNVCTPGPSVTAPKILA